MKALLAAAVMRDHEVDERPSTPLELFFDLCFVVAVAFLAGELHHGIAADHTAGALAAYGLLFVPIWWAWMSYTWYATAFSHDDALTRVLTCAQMAGILAVAAAVPAAANGHLVPFALAYAAMRVPLVLQWVRSALADPAHRGFAWTYAIGSLVAQGLWVTGALASGPLRAALFLLALAVELATPVAAVRRSPDRVFHPRHIAERYGLFTIIVLGETVLAVSIGFQEVVDLSAVAPSVLVTVGAALVVAFALWWLYFDALGSDALVRNRSAAFAWGYGHYAIFAATAAVGAGVRAEIDALADPARAHGGGGSAVGAVAVAVVLLALLLLARLSGPTPVAPLAGGALACLVLAVLATRLGATVTLALLAGVTVLVLVLHNRACRDLP